MSLLAAGKVNYRARIERAELLAQRFSSARQILGFYGHIARFQREFYEQLPTVWGQKGVARADGNFRAELNLPILLKPFGRFLSVMEAEGPGPLSTHARQVRIGGQDKWEGILTEFWKAGLLEPTRAEPLTEFLARAFLQPYAEFLASAQLPPLLPMTVCRCPRCNSLPVLGVLRREGDGGKRFLLFQHGDGICRFKRDARSLHSLPDGAVNCRLAAHGGA